MAGRLELQVSHHIQEVGIAASAGVGEVIASEEVAVAEGEAEVGVVRVAHEQVEFAADEAACIR